MPGILKDRGSRYSLEITAYQCLFIGSRGKFVVLIKGSDGFCYRNVPADRVVTGIRTREPDPGNVKNTPVSWKRKGDAFFVCQYLHSIERDILCRTFVKQ
jgi:hypothetical protein